MRKKHPEHVNLERWLVSYADFITLLFAFFVVMYALSIENVSKVKAAAESIRKAFGGTGAAPTSQLGPGVINPFDASNGGPGIPKPDLQLLRDQLEDTMNLEVGASDLSERMQMVFDDRGLVVRLAAKDFFVSGEAEVRPDLRPLLERIGRVIAGTKRLVRIEGHTDATEETSKEKSNGFPSDWELSAARAAWVAKYWITRFDLNPARLAIAGYSHYQPVDLGKSEWARARNRRVEIIILNHTQ